ncbi:GNAT family N-acetyltransferase [Streptomyces sp. NPDC049577]|uniref:GNAT family N-acetyltransferase n=1 Tax=Streptomyces sp. NPDC049577 TaxID=3155153 RepID=UPI00343CDEC3
MSEAELLTERLHLRGWRDSDLAPWAAINADPEVREHLGGPISREQSDAAVARFQAEFAERGYGWWAVEVRATGEFIGFAGLDRMDDGMPFTGVEIGWRLARRAWGDAAVLEPVAGAARDRPPSRRAAGQPVWNISAGSGLSSW